MGMAAMTEQVAREKKLKGSKCKLCGTVAFPPLPVCGKCGPGHATEMQPVELPTIGQVVTWTKLRVAPKGFPSPLIHCVLDLGVVKILGTVQGLSELENGTKLITSEDPSGRFPFVLRRLGNVD
jgi:uncharacterized OB-fold protein